MSDERREHWYDDASPAGSADTWLARARAALGEGRLADAVAHARRALEVEPSSAMAHHTLGAAFQARGELEGARAAYRRAAELRADYLSAQANLGVVSYGLADSAGARASFERALAIAPSYPPALVGRATSQLEFIHRDARELEAARRRYREALEDMVARLDGAGAPALALAADTLPLLQPFLLAYQGQNDRDLQAIYGAFAARAAAAARPEYARPVPVPTVAEGERLRVGFVSAHFRNHSNWKVPIRGWVENIDRSRFELYGYHVGRSRDATTEAAALAFDRWVEGPMSIDRWCETVRADRLHALILPEFGMDGPTFQLGSLRLAPVQITSWGHPETSGLPTIDYFLSSAAMEPEDGADHYTEDLVCLPNLSIHVTAPEDTADVVSRREIGVPETAILFWCCQTLYKYLPQFDDVFPRIATELPESCFVFIENAQRSVTDVFRGRLEGAFARHGLRAADHCVLLPHMGGARFAGVTALADVFLDSFGWSGCNSTLEAIAKNVPVVTLPGRTMRSRHTLAILERMGLAELAAEDMDELVRLAVRLGRDDAFRRATSELIAERKQLLYGDESPVRALERFLVDAVEAARAAGDRAIHQALEEARGHHRSSRWVEAEDAYRRVLALRADHPDAAHGLGVLAVQSGRHAVGQSLLEPLVERYPHSGESWLALAEAYRGQGRRDEALQCAERAIAHRPDWAPAHRLAARAAHELGHLDRALDHARRAVEHAPEAGLMHWDLARVLQALERYEEAAEAFRTALRILNPRYAEHALGRPAPAGQGTRPPPLPSASVLVGGISFPAIPPVPPGQPRPFWSVVIPAYDRRLYLLECIASALAAWAGPDDMEIIVVDNGSAPPLADVVHSVGCGLVRYVRHEKTVPLQVNWNSGLCESRGRWIHLMHDDDYVLPGFYATLRRALEGCAGTVGAAFTGYQNVDPNGVVRFSKQPYGTERGVAHDWIETIGVGNAMTPPSMVIKREAHERLGGYSEEILYTVDWEVYKRVASFYEWWYEPAILCHYRMHPVSVTKQEEEAGVEGYAARRAIEMSESYLPADRRASITARARSNYFRWCVRRLARPVQAGNVRGAMLLMQEALRIEHSDASAQMLFRELSEAYARDLRLEVARACPAEAPTSWLEPSADRADADRLFRELNAPGAIELRRHVTSSLLGLALGQDVTP